MAENIKASDLPDEQYQVAITVFMLAQGVDRSDAVDRARIAITRAVTNTPRMVLPARLPLPHRQGIVEGAEAIVVDVMDVGMAARNGYLGVTTTGLAFDL